MRVSIEHTEIQKGMLRKKTYHRITFDVGFNEEELQVIKENELKTMIVHETEPSASISVSPKEPAEAFYKRVSHFMDGAYSHDCKTILDAKVYEANITEGLRALKAVIDGNKEIEEKSSTFEL